MKQRLYFAYLLAMITSITLLQATMNDLISLQEIGKRTFYETFAASNTAENMESYLNEKFSLQQLTQELNTPDSLFYIAWNKTKAIGYLKVNFGNAQSELQDDSALEIERIYVSSDYQGQKVGQLLYNKALEIAQAHQKTYIWLGVWEENKKAIQFYQKNGFLTFDTHIFQMGDDAQTDLLMKKMI